MPDIYRAENRAFIGENQPFVCNRAIFCTNTPTSLLAGDRPVLRLIRYATLLGTLQLWVGEEQPLRAEDFASVKFTYRANLAEWELRDPRCPAAITLSAGAPQGVEGFVLRAQADAPVRLHWRFGGVHTFDGYHWNLNAAKPAEIGCAATPEEWFADNTVTEENGVFRFDAPDGSEGSGSDARRTQSTTVYLRCEQPAHISAAPACVQGELTLVPDAFSYISAGRTVPVQGAEGFALVLQRHEMLQNIFTSHTPDSFLDAQMAVLSAEIDGAWYGQYTVHSNQSWNAPYLGWCNRFGNMLGGWLDRVRTEVEYYCGYMNTTNDLRGMDADPEKNYAEAAPDSRYYGLGRILQHQFFYNMQSQFFDQAIFAWRMTNDPVLAGLLRRALEYHTRWQDECFDPDGDGLYESYINSWPTDAVWYNGGGSCEETCYAHRAHRAALELAEADGDTAAAAYHSEKLILIEKGFKEKLWLKDAGYPAMCIEDGGYGRAHRSAWLYNSFMPVDMDLVDPFEAAMCLDYPRWALENVPGPAGGKMVWISNWVPSTWSAREKSGGENLQQAYACFKAGFVQNGYDFLRGTMRKAPDAFDQTVSPGSIASESASLLARAVVCGLHGFRPDYPNGTVTVAPQYPADWDHASFATLYFSCDYRRSGDTVSYCFKMAQPAQKVRLEFPLHGAGIRSLTGAQAYTTAEGIGCRRLIIELQDTDCAGISFAVAQPAAPAAPLDLACAPGETLTPGIDGVTAVHDPQGVLAAYSVREGRAELQLRSDMDGNHMVFARRGEGEAALWQILRLDISATQQRLDYQAHTEMDTAGCRCEPLALPLTDDVKTIFKQNYYVPRGKICLTLAADGYAPWNFHYDTPPAPLVCMDKAGETVTDRQGVPFVIGSSERNIAFTSLYPNWPDSVSFPVGRAARAVKLLVCGSTNHMQVAIANAAVRFTYTDGSTEVLELVPPDNFWRLCGYNKAASNATTQDYSYERDGFCLPETPPDLIQLGENCRAVSLVWRLTKGKKLASVTLEALSQEVVIGLMALTLIDPLD